LIQTIWMNSEHYNQRPPTIDSNNMHPHHQAHNWSKGNHAPNLIKKSRFNLTHFMIHKPKKWQSKWGGSYSSDGHVGRGAGWVWVAMSTEHGEAASSGGDWGVGRGWGHRVRWSVQPADDDGRAHLQPAAVACRRAACGRWVGTWWLLQAVVVLQVTAVARAGGSDGGGADEQWQRQRGRAGAVVCVVWACEVWLNYWAPGQAQLLDRIHIIYDGRNWAVID
jgi:hypothetical protein